MMPMSASCSNQRNGDDKMVIKIYKDPKNLTVKCNAATNQTRNSFGLESSIKTAYVCSAGLNL